MKVQALLDFLIQNGQGWVRAQRDLHHPTARPLSAKETAGFAGFFEAQTLDSARIKNVPVIQNPEFYSQLTALGVRIPLDFTGMSGITFEDTILISVTMTPPSTAFAPLLFHELVHVVQYETLGLQAFVQTECRHGTGVTIAPEEKIGGQVACWPNFPIVGCGKRRKGVGSL